MGCGASRAADPAQSTSQAKAQECSTPDIKEGGSSRQLQKVSSQLGGKTVQNSFVIQKTRSGRKRAEEERKKVERDPNWVSKEEEPLSKDAAHTVTLPAESVNVEQPALQGPATSGQSFKMARGAQAKMLEELREKGQLQHVPEHKEKLTSSDPNTVMEGVTYFREQLSVVNPPVAAVRRSGILPTLVKLLEESKDRKMQYEVAWILTNICSAEHDDCAAVVDQNALPIFINLLSTFDESSSIPASDVIVQAIWALGNIAADSPDLQRAVLDEGVVQPLLACMERSMPEPSVLRHCVWLLSNLCRPKPQDDALLEAVPVVCSIIASCADQEAITHACWALAYLTGAERGAAALAEVEHSKDTLAKLVKWVEEATSMTTIPSLRSLSHLCAGSHANLQAVVDARGLPAMLACLHKCGRLSLKKDVVWALANVASGDSSQVEALVNAGAFPVVKELLHSNEESLKRECTYVLANPWSAQVGVSNEVAHLLLREGVIQELVNLLDLSNDPTIIKITLDGLKEAIRRGQQMMKEEATALENVGAEVSNVTNRISDSIKAHGAMDRLQNVLATTDPDLHATAKSLHTVLAFM